VALRLHEQELEDRENGLTEEDQSAKEALALAKRLSFDAREAAKPHKKGIQQNLDYLLGLGGHHKVAVTQAARELSSWSSQTVRNWLFALVNNKNGKIKEAEPTLTVEDLDDSTDSMQRLVVKSHMEHELARLRWLPIRSKIFQWGAAGGMGVSMTTLRPDPNLDPAQPLEQKMLVLLRAINPEEFYFDPSVDEIHDPECRYVVWEPLMDFSKLFEMWPTAAAKLKPEGPKMDISTASGQFDSVTYKSQSNDDNLIYGSSGTYLQEPKGKLALRKARVCFVWIRNESIVAEVERTVIKEPRTGYHCPSCDLTYDEPTDMCAACGGTTEAIRVPGEASETRRIRRAYPYGRLIVYSGDSLIYDGDNPYELEEVFPFQTYYHYQPPGRPYGYGDVALLKPIQDAADLSISQLQDYVVLAVYGLMEYPMGAKAYSKLGNAPRQTYPVPDHLVGKARIISPSDFNSPAWEALDRTLFREMQVVGQLEDTAGPPFGQAPISATEVQAIQSALSAGMRGHLERLNDWDTQVANAVFQLGKQAYGARSAPVVMPDGARKPIEADWSSFRDVRIRISASIKEAQEDKNLGQNTLGLIQGGLLPREDLDLALPKLGWSAQDIKELNERNQLRQEIAPPGLPPVPPQEAIAPPEGGM